MFCARESFVSWLLIPSKVEFSVLGFLLSFILGEWKQTHKDIPCLQSWLCHQLNVWPFGCHFAKSYWWFPEAWGEELALQESCFGGRLFAKHLSQENKPFSKLLYFTGWTLYPSLKWIWNLLQANCSKRQGIIKCLCLGWMCSHDNSPINEFY